MMGEAVWRAVYLEDDRVFLKNSEEERLNVSVDLMLDASASRMGHELSLIHISSRLIFSEKWSSM